MSKAVKAKPVAKLDSKKSAPKAAPKPVLNEPPTEKQIAGKVAAELVAKKPFGKVLDPDEVINVPAMIDFRVQLQLKRGTSQLDRMKAAIKELKSKSEEELLKLAFIKCDCTSAKTHNERADLWSAGTGAGHKAGSDFKKL